MNIARHRELDYSANVEPQNAAPQDDDESEEEDYGIFYAPSRYSELDYLANVAPLNAAPQYDDEYDDEFEEDYEIVYVPSLFCIRLFQIVANGIGSR